MGYWLCVVVIFYDYFFKMYDEVFDEEIFFRKFCVYSWSGRWSDWWFGLVGFCGFGGFWFVFGFVCVE